MACNRRGAVPTTPTRLLVKFQRQSEEAAGCVALAQFPKPLELRHVRVGQIRRPDSVTCRNLFPLSYAAVTVCLLVDRAVTLVSELDVRSLRSGVGKHVRE